MIRQLQWKLSPMDLGSFGRWYDYSMGRDAMFKVTNSKHAPWFVVRSDDKKKARLDRITHFLSMILYRRSRAKK
jgi:polyphosphate kinase 2 (PPK2 family)